MPSSALLPDSAGAPNRASSDPFPTTHPRDDQSGQLSDGLLCVNCCLRTFLSRPPISPLLRNLVTVPAKCSSEDIIIMSGLPPPQSGANALQALDVDGDSGFHALQDDFPNDQSLPDVDMDDGDSALGDDT
ncbi:hypothetical protein KC352_g12416 [Hortaea werneckii]|nr:hypothetical protein KC352_g12416 [Hortaea werneckii]